MGIHSSLFDYIVGTGENSLRNGQPYRPGSLQVDDQLVSRWLLHRQIAWLLSSQDAVDISRGTAKQVDEIGAI